MWPVSFVGNQSRNHGTRCQIYRGNFSFIVPCNHTGKHLSRIGGDSLVVEVSGAHSIEARGQARLAALVHDLANLLSHFDISRDFLISTTEATKSHDVFSVLHQTCFAASSIWTAGCDLKCCIYFAVV